VKPFERIEPMRPATSHLVGETEVSGGTFDAGTLGERVAEKLLAKIRSDGLAPGTRLPSEHAMAQHFGVSRTVMREAIALLKADGLLTTRKGSGAFVAQTGFPRAAKG